ncbi:MAG: ATP synthase F1 subunit gamma [Candidatus Buchananbacteria bacterium]
MALSTKIIKKRVRSIGNTKKITKALEMVSAVKMRKAVAAVLASRDYSGAAWNLVLSLAKKANAADHPLLTQRAEIKKIGFVLISSNRGLCGGFNSQIISQAISYAKNQPGEAEWIAIGKKGAEFLARSGEKLVAEFDKPDLIAGLTDILPIAKMLIKDYVNGNYDKIILAYTDFYSAMTQKPKIKQLLPFEPVKDADLGSVGSPATEKTQTTFEDFEYLFEPTKTEILNLFLPRLIEIQLYQAMLESAASEHSARMLAMKNASSAAADMIDSLTLAFNQARQASITREIAEITGSKAALE